MAHISHPSTSFSFLPAGRDNASRPAPSIVDPSGRPVTSASLFDGSVGRGSGYEAAQFGRRLVTWGLSSAGPNAVLMQSLSALRARSRELIRNNIHASAAVDRLVSNLIGNGITPLWRMPSSYTGIKEGWQELWSDSQSEIDFTYSLDFYGLEALATRSMVQSGEVLARLIPLHGRRSTLVPLQVQLIEPDHLDETYNTIAPNGNRIRMGIEIDKAGRRAAYWLHREHPGDIYMDGANNYDRVRVPVSRIIHMGKASRPGQLRFPAWLAPAIVRLHELDQYQDAELVRKKTAAMFGGFIKEPPTDIPAWAHLGPEDDQANSAASVPPEGVADKVIALEPGSFPILPPGMDVKFAEPSDVGSNYDVFLKYELRGIAASMGVTYEQLSGDLSDVNFSSIRAGLLEFKRFCRQVINQIIVHQFCRPVIRAWMDAAVLAGVAPVGVQSYLQNKHLHQRVAWQHDGWEFVDPVKDINAARLAVRNGFMSRSEVIGLLTGADPAKVDAEIAQDNDRASGYGVKYDSNPCDDVKRGV